MNRVISMAILVCVAFVLGLGSLIRGLALAVLGSVAVKVGSQAGGDVTIIAGVILTIAGILTWVFADALWNSKPNKRVLGLAAADLVLIAAVLNLTQGSSVRVEIGWITAALVIVVYLTMFHVRKIFHRDHSTVVAYGRAG